MSLNLYRQTKASSIIQRRNSVENGDLAQKKHQMFQSTLQERSQDFSRGGGESHGAKTRLLTRFSGRFYHLLQVVCLKHGLQGLQVVCLKHGLQGGGSWAPQDPPGNAPTPLHRRNWKTHQSPVILDLWLKKTRPGIKNHIIIAKRFLSTRKRKEGVFKFLRFEERLRKVSFSRSDQCGQQALQEI